MKKIFKVEYNDVEHAKYCDTIVAALKKGETIFNMGPWQSLDADAVTAIEESRTDVTIEYIGQGIGFRVVIPAGSEISRFEDDHGTVCIVCLAEYYGYKHIEADEVLRQPLSITNWITQIAGTTDSPIITIWKAMRHCIFCLILRHISRQRNIPVPAPLP